MKKELLSTLFFVVLISSAHSINVLHMLDGWNELATEAKNSEFSRHLINTLELSLKKPGKVEQVIKFLKDGITVAQKNQEDARQQNIQEMAKLVAQIKSNELDLENNKLWREQNVEAIQKLKTEIDFLTTEISNAQQFLQNLSDRQANLEQVRKTEHGAFFIRQARQGNIIEALIIIIDALEGLARKGSSFLENTLDEVNTALKKLPEGHPIEALVQLTSTFNKDQIMVIIQKLNGILEETQKAKAEDEEKELQDNQQHKGLLQEIQSARFSKSNQLKAYKFTLNNRNIRMTAEQNKREVLDRTYTLLKKSYDDLVALRDATQRAFQTKNSESDQAIRSLKLALKILLENKGKI